MRKGHLPDACKTSDEEWFATHGAGIDDPEFEGVVEFDRIVKPLELRHGFPLNGTGRVKCLRAFAESPEAFARLAERALERGNRNPVGLLIRMVDDRDHGLVEAKALVSRLTDAIPEIS